MPKFLLALFSVLAIAAMPAAAQNDTVVKLAGSNTIGGGLLAEYTRGYALKLGMGGTTIVELPKPDEFDIIASRPENKGTLRVHVEAHGTGTGAADKDVTSSTALARSRNRFITGTARVVTQRARRSKRDGGYQLIVKPN